MVPDVSFAADLPYPAFEASAGLPAPGSRIVVAMSGGVDSAVVAALLTHAGYDVVGVTMQLYDHGAATGKKGTCCAGQDVHDARRVADHLRIPHYVLDFEQRFRTAVVDAFADSYAKGETPIPCVLCNSRMKFTDLLGLARDFGAAALATGHYVRRADTAAGPGLYRAADGDRDQSYFLFNTTRAQLSGVVFPLGHWTKAHVRASARSMGLPVSDKPDSQDICFVPSGHYSDVVAKLRPDAAAPGDIVHVDGRILGRHDGIFRYTIGQRKGLGIAAAAPLYVVRLEAKARQVIVGPRTALDVHRIALRNVNWLADEPFADLARDDGLEIAVRVRSSQPLQPATLVARGGSLDVLLNRPEPGIAAGQACVFYVSDAPGARVMGGGWIERSLDRAGRAIGASPGARASADDNSVTAAVLPAAG
jgi:tRNA-specific 2-thiouridylase